MREACPLPGTRGWLLAMLLAMLLHLIVAAVALWSPTRTPQGQAVAAGTGGVEISLGPAGSAAGSSQQETASEELSEAEPDPQPEPETKPEPEPEPEPRPEPVQQAQQPTITEPLPSQASAPAPPPAASVAGSSGNSGSTQLDNTGSGDNSAGGALPGDRKDYAATLLAWLERHKEYPRRARLRRQQGTVQLYFMVDRAGKVLDYRIEQGSGHRALDDEVLAMIERAQPLPTMPEDLEKETLELVVPVQFFLR